MTIAANKQLVTDFMALFSEARLDDAFALVDDAATWSLWGSGPAAGSHDKPAMKELLRQSFAMFQGPLRWWPTGFTAEEDRVAVLAESDATTHGGFRYRNHYHMLFRVRDGMIVEVREMFEEGPVQALFASLQGEATQ